MICGIDEAGKGPVLGPLVIAGVSASKEEIALLKELGVKDSKDLTKEQREEMFEEIKKLSHEIIIVNAPEIDEALFHPSLNFNKLEVIKTAQILETLKPEEAYVDSPDRNTDRYKQMILEKSKVQPSMIVENKAERYEVVAAASILAKVTRDRLVKEFHKIHEDCGSGYASDPKTKEFVKKHWNNEDYAFFIRHSWETIKNLKRGKEQQTLQFEKD